MADEHEIDDHVRVRLILSYRLQGAGESCDVPRIYIPYAGSERDS